jgi:protein-disulfide isomerase
MASRRQRLVVLALLALLVIGPAIRLSQSIAESGNGTQATTGVRQSVALFSGIPQRGATLGDPQAPVTLTEFADLQCPFCRQYADRVLPALVNRYVRSGRVKLVFRDLAFIGPDSRRAARVAAAAGLQGRLWQFTDLLYRNQGRENSGFATDPFLRRIAEGAGVDAGRAFAQRNSSAVTRQLEAAAGQARRYRVNGTPSFLLGRRGAPTRLLMPSALSAAAFEGLIDAALRGA